MRSVGPGTTRHVRGRDGVVSGPAGHDAAIDREDLRWHDLRHSGAVLAAAAGATLAELMARLGHSTPGAALKYQHAVAGSDHAVAERLSKLAI